jgi:beta-glucosidase/6-phospho-beta-glucosidase/beta-galactosidase
MLKSFFLAGFECATGYNSQGEWIDQIAATQHDRFADDDYRLLTDLDIYGVREGVRWPLVDRRGRYDFSSVRPHVEAARKYEVEVIWDLFHYGYPEDVEIFSEEFPGRFADYCYAFARYVSARTDGVCYFTPVNEPSFYSWAGGQVGLFAPHQKDRGWEMKAYLCRAAIQGINAIRAACPGARIVNVDPICRVVHPEDDEELEGRAIHFNERAVWECWDMIAGTLMPELGGSREHLDIVGMNYYWTNQWCVSRLGVPLEPSDPRCHPLRNLVRATWERYGGDVLITETTHRDENRAHWIRELAEECQALLDEGIPLRGATLYPVLGMPEWHDQEDWTRMGLWDLLPENGKLSRVPYRPMISALKEAQLSLEGRQFESQAAVGCAVAAGR